MYNLQNEKSIIIAPDVQKTFEKYRKNLPSNESGGVLFGKIYKNKYISIEEVTEPSWLDKAGFYFFERNAKRAQRIINKRWKESNGELIYLGEWHTHNEDKPMPSMRDRDMIKNSLEGAVMEIDFLILIIIGMKKDYTSLQLKNKFLKLDNTDNPLIFDINIKNQTKV